MLATAALLVGLILLCVASSAYAIRTAPFDAREYRPYLLQGKSSITGQAFARTKSGDVKRAAGCRVLLTPGTSTGMAWLESVATEGQYDPDLLGRALAFSRTTVADAEGRFRFSRIPTGRYIVTTELSWQYGISEKQTVHVVLAKIVEIGKAQRLSDIVLEPVMAVQPEEEAD